jgi:hypothetical protein
MMPPPGHQAAPKKVLVAKGLSRWDQQQIDQQGPGMGHFDGSASGLLAQRQRSKQQPGPCPPRVIFWTRPHASPMPALCQCQPHANPMPTPMQPHATPCQPHANPMQSHASPCQPHATPCVGGFRPGPPPQRPEPSAPPSARVAHAHALTHTGQGQFPLVFHTPQQLLHKTRIGRWLGPSGRAIYAKLSLPGHWALDAGWTGAGALCCALCCAATAVASGFAVLNPPHHPLPPPLARHSSACGAAAGKAMGKL